MFFTRLRKAFHIVLLSAGVSAGVGSVANVQRLEQAALAKPPETRLPDFYDLDNFGELLQYGFRLSNAYVDLADRATGVQDLTAFAIIGSAATAAGGLLFGASTDLIKVTGLTAGTVLALNNYVKPSEAAKVLLDASDQLLCVFAGE